MDIFQSKKRRITNSIEPKQITIMKSTAYFTRTILTHLEQRASQDPLFAQSFANPDKDIDQCCIYILNQVQKSGCNGFHDDEIFNMAVHFYDEDTIEIGEPKNNAHVVVNHFVELTEEEKQQAKTDAIKKAQDEAYKTVTTKKVMKKEVIVEQGSLF